MLPQRGDRVRVIYDGIVREVSGNNTCWVDLGDDKVISSNWSSEVQVVEATVPHWCRRAALRCGIDPADNEKVAWMLYEEFLAGND